MTVGFQTRESFLAEKFSEDGRAQVVFDWLDGTRPQSMHCVRDLEQAEHDFEAAKQLRVTQSAFRVIAYGVGRGAMFLGRMTKFPDLPIHFQHVTLSVKLLPSTLTACPDLSLFPLEGMHWPEFHNGVAQALELPFSGSVTRGWILQHQGLVEQARIRRTPQESPELMTDRLAGLLFALGLFKQLSVLRADDLYRFLRLNSEIVTISVILGAAISGHSRASKLALMHVFPPDPEVEISGIVQSASLLALGFSYAGSNDRLTAELLLGEIGKRPIAGDRILVNESESFNLAAGLGLGLVLLGRGPEMSQDLQLKNRLISLVGTCDVGSLRPLAASQLHQRSLGDPATRSNLVYEGTKPNVTLTAGAASLALGFGWWKTGDASALKALSIPKTMSELESSPRPETLFFRALAYWLVAWEELSVDTIFDFSPKETTDFLLVIQTSAYIQAALGLALGLKFAGTRNPDVKKRLLESALSLVLNRKPFLASQTARMASKPSGQRSEELDRYTLETVRVLALISVTLVEAGSGDLEVLRLIRAMRMQTDDQTSFGTHQGISQALGFLFLGGGKKTFDNSSNFKLACLLISVIPRYPVNANDQRFSLHASRHLYVLATRVREAEGQDDRSSSVSEQLPRFVRMLEDSGLL